ncbi:MAG: hypothetical protein IPM48_01665 [Saprospiraceae bacterium]|nr:hypothetical protein [Saprospiraceae bacterium]
MRVSEFLKMRKSSPPMTLIGFMLVLVVGIAMIGPNLIREGMFMDGIIYAVLSRNLADGIGSFWYLEFCGDPKVVFHEHPPLMMGLQSIFFSFCDNCFYNERIFSLLVFLGIAFWQIKIWKMLSPHASMAWLPVLFLMLMPKVAWSVCANMLENTMSFFLCASFYFYLRFRVERNWWWILLVGFTIFGGFMCKGFVSLFVWSIPFWFFVFSNTRNLWAMVTESLALVFGIVFGFVLTAFIFPNAVDSILNKYLTIQVLDSLANETTVSNRFQIVIWFLRESILPVILTIVFGILVRFKFSKYLPSDRGYAVLMAVALSGILPIMISMKQYSHYITPGLIFFALGLALLCQEVWRGIMNRIEPKFKYVQNALWFVLLLELTGLFLIRNIPSRDQEKIQLVKDFEKMEGDKNVIGMNPEVSDDYSIEAYFNRYSRTCFAPNDSSRTYYISKGHVPNSHEFLLQGAGYTISKTATQ